MTSPNHAWIRRRREAARVEGQREVTTLVSDSVYLQARELAQKHNTRLPIVLGHLADVGLAVMNGESPDLRSPSSSEHDMGFQPAQLVELSQAVLASRFPDDTGSARMRQLAFLTLVTAETAQGNKPFAADLARITGGQPEQMRLLATILEKRGVVSLTRVSNYRDRPTGKIIEINPNATSRLMEAHLRETGRAIDMTLEADL